MSLVTGLAWLSGQILSAVHMRNFRLLAEIIFQSGFCPHGKFQPGYRDEQGVTFHISSLSVTGLDVHMGKFPTWLLRSWFLRPG